MYEKAVLPNGVTIAIEEMPFVRSVAFGFWVHTGSRHEKRGENGVSHFLEHMLFKGTAARSARDIADQMDAIGGQLNAYTSKEYTCYYIRVLDDHFGRALDILADMFFNSSFEPDEIEKEKNVILEEINMYEDTPEDLVHDILQTAAFGGDPLGFPILGSEETISRFGRETFTGYKSRRYCPQNTVIAVAGNIKAVEAVEKLGEYFGGFRAEYEKPAFNSVYKPALAAKDKDIEQVHLCLAFPGIPAASEETYALSVLNTLLGGGMSSRLFQSIREDKGLAYSIYSYAQSYSDTGIYSVYAALNPQMVGKAFRYIREEINNLFVNKITPAQIERTKDQLKSNYLLSLENSSSRMSSIGRSQLLTGEILTPDELIGKIESVTYDDIYALAERVLDFKRLSVSAVGRVKDLDLEGLIKNAG